jgi:hypothetical protein
MSNKHFQDNSLFFNDLKKQLFNRDLDVGGVEHLYERNQ